MWSALDFGPLGVSTCPECQISRVALSLSIYTDFGVSVTWRPDLEIDWACLNYQRTQGPIKFKGL
jgi:hypothetical protein